MVIAIAIVSRDEFGLQWDYLYIIEFVLGHFMYRVATGIVLCLVLVPCEL